MFVKIINKIRSKIQICVCSEKVVICKYKTMYSLSFYYNNRNVYMWGTSYIWRLIQQLKCAEYCVLTPFPVHQVSAVLVNTRFTQASCLPWPDEPICNMHWLSWLTSKFSYYKYGNVS